MFFTELCKYHITKEIILQFLSHWSHLRGLCFNNHHAGNVCRPSVAYAEDLTYHRH